MIKSRSQFQKTPRLSGVYQWVMRNSPSLMDQLLPPKRNEWTTKKLILDALKYDTRIAWMQSSRYAYVASKKMGVFEQCTRHMASNIAQHFNRKVINMNTQEVHNSLKQASKRSRVGYTNISHGIRKGHKAGGYHWAYYDEKKHGPIIEKNGKMYASKLKQRK